MKKFVFLALLFFCVSFFFGQENNKNQLYFVNFEKDFDIEKMKGEFPDAVFYKNSEIANGNLSYYVNGINYDANGKCNSICYDLNKTKIIKVPEMSDGYVWSLAYFQEGRNDAAPGWMPIIFNDRTIDIETILKLESFVIDNNNNNYDPDDFCYLYERVRPLLFGGHEIYKSSYKLEEICFEIPFKIENNADSYFETVKRYTFYIEEGYYKQDEIKWNLMQLNKNELRLLRNAVYASKGYVFKDKKLNEFFLQSQAYIPDKSLKESRINFTENELKLLALIKELEK